MGATGCVTMGVSLGGVFAGVKVASEEKTGRIRDLVEVSKEKGYLLYDDVSEILPDDLTSGGHLDDLLADLEVAGVELLVEPKEVGFGGKFEDGDDSGEADGAASLAVSALVRMTVGPLGRGSPGGAPGVVPGAGLSP